VIAAPPRRIAWGWPVAQAKVVPHGRVPERHQALILHGVSDAPGGFWREHRSALLVSIVGTTIGTVLAAAIVFVASSLGGLLDVSSTDVWTTLAYAGGGLLIVVYGGLDIAERFLKFQVRRAEAEAERARLAAVVRRSRDV
jgi:hypothetical protein